MQSKTNAPRIRIRFGAAYNDIDPAYSASASGKQEVFQLPAPPEPKRHGWRVREERLSALSFVASTLCEALGIVGRHAIRERRDTSAARARLPRRNQSRKAARRAVLAA